MTEKELSGEGQQIIAQLRSHEAHSNWRVFRISRRKLIWLNVSLCTCVSLCMGFLAWYVWENPDHHPLVPPEALHAVLTIVLVCLVGTLLLSLAVWITMKDVVLVLTPEALVRGNSKKPRRTWCIAYRDIAAVDVDGSSVLIRSKKTPGRKKQIDCRLFDVSPKVITSALLAAYEDFRTQHAHTHSRTH